MTRLISLIRPLITILHPFVVSVHSLCLDICTSFMILRPPRASRRNIRGFKALGNFCCYGVRVTDLLLKHLICCKIYKVKQAFLSSILFSPLKPHLDSYLHISPFYYFHIFSSILYLINYPLTGTSVASLLWLVLSVHLMTFGITMGTNLWGFLDWLNWDEKNPLQMKVGSFSCPRGLDWMKTEN